MHLGPIEGSVFQRMKPDDSIPLPSGRGSVKFIGQDRLGVLLATGPREVVASVPWAALEGVLSLLQQGDWVRVGCRYHPDLAPSSLAGYVGLWTGYKSAASWTAALLNAIGVVEVQARPAARVRLMVESIPELALWNDNRQRLSERQVEALDMEIKTAAFYILEGLRAITELTDSRDFYPGAVSIFAFGLEHLFKLTLVLGTLHLERRFPTSREYRDAYKTHDLDMLRRSLVSLMRDTRLPPAFPWQGAIEYLDLGGGPITGSLLSLGEELALGGRYFHLEELLGGSTRADPDQAFREFQQTIADLTADEPGELPELFWIMEYQGAAAFYRARNDLILNDLVSFVETLAHVAYFFNPIKDPSLLAVLMYPRWHNELPKQQPLGRVIRRPRQWVDAALRNERWKQSTAESSIAD
jgi:hypothetical protein